PSASRLLAGLLVAAGIAATSPAFAVCGNAVLDAGEQCDRTASRGGDAACPGAGIPPGLVGECACARPSTEVRRYVAVGGTQVRLGTNVLVGGGNLAATRSGGLIQIGPGSITTERTELIGDRARVLGGAAIGRLFANAAFVRANATLAGGGPLPVALPLVLPGEMEPPPGTAGP